MKANNFHSDSFSGLKTAQVCGSLWDTMSFKEDITKVILEPRFWSRFCLKTSYSKVDKSHPNDVNTFKRFMRFPRLREGFLEIVPSVSSGFCILADVRSKFLWGTGVTDGVGWGGGWG